MGGVNIQALTPGIIGRGVSQSKDVLESLAGSSSLITYVSEEEWIPE